MLRVLIVDDSWVWASALACQVDRADGMRLIGTTGLVAEGLEMLAEHRPDVVLLDMYLEGDTGLRLARTAASRSLPGHLVMMSVEPSRWAVEQGRAAGIAGFVHKDDLLTGDAIVSVIRSVAAGQHVFTQRVPTGDTGGAAAALSPQEVELVRCLRDGLGTPEIAEHLSIGRQTVRNKIHRIGAKLGARGRLEIVARASVSGLVGRHRAI